MKKSIESRNGLISVIIPTFNEEDNLPILFDAIKTLNEYLLDFGNTLEVIIVDNKSNDNTWNHLIEWSQNKSNDFKIRIYQHPENLGMQQSLLTGVKLSNGNAVAVMQSDLQDPPEILQKMMLGWVNGNDYVATKISKREGPLIPRIGAWGFYRLLSFFSENKILSDSSDFYLFDSKMIKPLIRQSGSTPFLRATLSSLSTPDLVIEYTRKDRKEGNTNFNVKRRINFALDALLRDLGGLVKKVTVLALLLAAITFLGLFTLGLAYVFGYRSPVAGWLTSTALLLIILSATMLIGALTLELLHRIYKDLPRKDYSAGGELYEN